MNMCMSIYERTSASTVAHVYDVIDVSGRTNPSRMRKISPSHRPLPNILPIVGPPTGGNVDVAREGKKEVVHATIPGDQ